MAGRARSNSVKQAIEQMEPTREVEGDVAARRKGPKRAGVKAAQSPLPASSPMFSWLVQPRQSATIIALVVALWAAFEVGPLRSLVSSNPLAPLLFISYPLSQDVQDGKDDVPRYGKGPLDLLFLAFYIVVFSFLRQSLMEYILRPFANSLGLKSESKVARFLEQSYAIVYFTASGSFGLVRFR